MSPTLSEGDVPIDAEGLGEEKARLILARRVKLARERPVPREAGLAVIICLIGGERFAVPIAAVAEVMPATTPVRVPTAPDSLAGLIVRRGLVYNLIDPSSALGVPRPKSMHVLLLRGAVPRLALQIDEAVEASEVADVVSDGGLTQTRFSADGVRVELIAIERLVAALGHKGRTEPA